MNNDLGKKVKKIRTDAGKTQRRVAADTQIHSSRISRIETGSYWPTETEISALARYFSNLELLRVWWASSESHETMKYLCTRMGLEIPRHKVTTVEHFCEAIIRRTHTVLSLIREAPTDEAGHQEAYLLAGQELDTIGNLATALRLLICDIKGG